MRAGGIQRVINGCYLARGSKSTQTWPDVANGRPRACGSWWWHARGPIRDSGRNDRRTEWPQGRHDLRGEQLHAAHRLGVCDVTEREQADDLSESELLL